MLKWTKLKVMTYLSQIRTIVSKGYCTKVFLKKPALFFPNKLIVKRFDWALVSGGTSSSMLGIIIGDNKKNIVACQSIATCCNYRMRLVSAFQPSYLTAVSSLSRKKRMHPNFLQISFLVVMILHPIWRQYNSSISFQYTRIKVYFC